MSYIGTKPADAALTASDITDNIISLAKMSSGTDGNLITYDASGNPAAVATGTSGHFLKSQGAGSVPVFAAAAAGGKIGQIVQTVKTDRSTYASASFADISGMSVAITPVATSSKILVMTDAFVSVTSNLGVHIKLLRGSSDLYIGDAASSRSRASKGAVYYHGASGFSMAFHYLDSPSTTSATTYKLQWYPESGGTAAIGGTQSDGDAVYNSRTANSITVMEVLA